MHATHATPTRLLATAAAVLLALPLAACTSQPPSGGFVSGESAAPSSAIGEAPLTDTQVQTLPGERAAMDRSVISTGSISLEVADPRAAVAAAVQVAAGLDGHVDSQTLSQSGSGSTESATLTLRVPSAKLAQAFSELGALGTVLNESRTADDVTAQHVDLQARVASLETSVTRLQELMAGSATTSELLEAESALAARQAELDGLKAQLTMLEDQVNESTIWVSFTMKSALPGGPANFWDGLLAGLSSIVAAGAGALVLLGVLLPWLAIVAVLAGAVLLIVRGRRKRRAGRLAATTPGSVAAPAAEPQPDPAPQSATEGN